MSDYKKGYQPYFTLTDEEISQLDLDTRIWLAKIAMKLWTRALKIQTKKEQDQIAEKICERYNL